MKTINDFFGSRVREARKTKGWSIERLSLESNVNKNYISDLERGKRNPTLLIVDTLCNALDIPVHIMFKPRKKS